ncbi:MAG: hypothetical protein ACTSXS_11110 [Candidatus Thorarchaeota archaeon]
MVDELYPLTPSIQLNNDALPGAHSALPLASWLSSNNIRADVKSATVDMSLSDSEEYVCGVTNDNGIGIIIMRISAKAITLVVRIVILTNWIIGAG